MSDETADDKAADDTAADVVETEPRMSRIASATVAIVFGLLFAYSLFSAISNAVALPGVYEAYGFGDRVPWLLLIAGIVMPPIVYAAAFLLARRRVMFSQVLIFAVALATSYALSLSMIALAPFLLTL